MFVDLKWGGLAVLALACTLARAADDAVTSEAFGAAGDGKTDDQAAIVRAHAEANRRNVPVRAVDRPTSASRSPPPASSSYATRTCGSTSVSARTPTCSEM